MGNNPVIIWIGTSSGLLAILSAFLQNWSLSAIATVSCVAAFVFLLVLSTATVPEGAIAPPKKPRFRRSDKPLQYWTQESYYRYSSTRSDRLRDERDARDFLPCYYCDRRGSIVAHASLVKQQSTKNRDYSERVEICPVCNGQGRFPTRTLSKQPRCRACRGRGKLVSTKADSFSDTTEVVICPACNGTGRAPKR